MQSNVIISEVKKCFFKSYLGEFIIRILYITLFALIFYSSLLTEERNYAKCFFKGFG